MQDTEQELFEPGDRFCTGERMAAMSCFKLVPVYLIPHPCTLMVLFHQEGLQGTILSLTGYSVIISPLWSYTKTMGTWVLGVIFASTRYLETHISVMCFPREIGYNERVEALSALKAAIKAMFVALQIVFQFLQWITQEKETYTEDVNSTEWSSTTLDLMRWKSMNKSVKLLSLND